MILTPSLERQIIDTIQEDPTETLILPDWAYGRDGRVVVLDDGLPVDLHRYLFDRMIRPLCYRERMFDRSGVEGNVNPFLFDVPLVGLSPATACPRGHAYEGNEAPPNSRGYRCRICLRAAIARDNERRRGRAGIANADKEFCPRDHPYTPENTVIFKDGKRRCRTCRNERNAKYMRDIRAIGKEAA